MERRRVRKLGLMSAATGLAGALMLSTGSAAAEPPLPGPPAPIDPMAMPGSPPEPFVLPPGSIQGPLSDLSRPAPGDGRDIKGGAASADDAVGCDALTGLDEHPVADPQFRWRDGLFAAVTQHGRLVGHQRQQRAQSASGARQRVLL